MVRKEMNLSQIEKKNRYQKNKRMYEEAKTEALEHMIKTVNRGLSMQMEMVMLLVLHDKFGFGAERCAKALLAFENMWADVGDKRLELDDIEKVVRDEIRIVVEETAIYQLDNKGNRKQIWSGEK